MSLITSKAAFATRCRLVARVLSANAQKGGIRSGMCSRLGAIDIVEIPLLASRFINGYGTDLIYIYYRLAEVRW